MHISQDDWNVERVGNRLRLAVADGVTPWRSPAHPVGEDGAVWAASVARAASRTVGHVTDVLAAAHSALYDGTVTPTRRRLGAALGVADITISDRALHVQAAACADVDIWARTDSRWAHLAGADALAPGWREKWEQHKQKHPELCGEKLLEEEARILDRADTRSSPAAGRDSTIHPSGGTLSDVNELVVASDGAHLDVGRLDNIEHTLHMLCRQSHGDLTVIRATLH